MLAAIQKNLRRSSQISAQKHHLEPFLMTTLKTAEDGCSKTCMEQPPARYGYAMELHSIQECGQQTHESLVTKMLQKKYPMLQEKIPSSKTFFEFFQIFGFFSIHGRNIVY